MHRPARNVSWLAIHVTGFVVVYNVLGNVVSVHPTTRVVVHVSTIAVIQPTPLIENFGGRGLDHHGRFGLRCDDSAGVNCTANE